MCGICGFSGFEDKALVRKMCKSLYHRGPDDDGFFHDKNVNLGVRRLSIIDVSGGHQPIHNEEQTAWIIFNGEIYNYLELREALEKKGHKFYTKSDTEVIIHCYEEFGLDCPKKLRGDFSFAIWDYEKKRLMLARDRLGVAPLYYAVLDKKIIFASEIKAILECKEVKKEIDYEGLHHYLTFQYIPSPLTIFRGIRKLPPGHVLVFESGKCNISKYWDVESGITNFSEDYYSAKIMEILKESVKIRLMSEVPLGVYLSGGLDSSTITALTSMISGEGVKTFSLGSDHPPDNELRYAKMVSERFGTDHKEVMVSTDSIIRNIEKIFWYMDEPIGDTALIPEFFLSEFAKKKVTVILSGGGSDELFGGYENYKNVMFFHKLKNAIPSPMRPFIPKIAERMTRNPTKLEYARFLSSGKDDILYRGQGYLFYYDKPELYNDSTKNLTACIEPKDVIKRYFLNNNFDLFHKLAYVDLKIFIPDNCTNHGDRMGYSHSVEVRSPFLDHHLVEFAFQIPHSLKIRGKTVKYILKKTMKDILPQEVLTRQKWGFPAPPNYWFSKKNFMEFTENNLDESEFVRKHFNNEKIRNLIENSYKPKESHKLWGLLALSVWHDVFFEK